MTDNNRRERLRRGKCGVEAGWFTDICGKCRVDEVGRDEICSGGWDLGILDNFGGKCLDLHWKKI